jgi:hypothetical protein
VTELKIGTDGDENLFINFKWPNIYASSLYFFGPPQAEGQCPLSPLLQLDISAEVPPPAGQYGSLAGCLRCGWDSEMETDFKK